MDLQARKALVTEKYEAFFHQPPKVWARAPGRVDLMGSHTDYNLGYVMTMSVDRDTWIAARARTDGEVAIYSLNVEGGGAFPLNSISHDPENHWTDYIRGMAWALQAEGYRLTGFNGLVHSTVPFGSGLSSSAAIEMAAGIVFQQVSGLILDPVQMALYGQKAENHFVGVNSGILDQYSSAMGQAGCALLLDCRSLTSRVTPIARGLQVMICDTRAERNLAGTEYGERRAQCEEGVRILQRFFPHIRALRDVTMKQFQTHEQDLPPIVAKRCRFILEENQRVLDLADALPTGDVERLGTLFSSSYAGARDLYEISAPAMEAMMAAMTTAPGVVGARQAGAGFGGCMVALVQSGQVEAFAAHTIEQYQSKTGIEPQVYPVEASAGAGLV